jgi:Tfp pilus assembly protein PilV
MPTRPEERYRVDFQVFLAWHKNGVAQRVAGRCVDLSPSGAKLETRDKLETRSTVLVHSEQFGRMGLASIRHCTRQGMKYDVGLEFSTAFGMSSPTRRKALEKVQRADAAQQG